MPRETSRMRMCAALVALLAIPNTAWAQKIRLQTAPTTVPGSTPAPKQLALEDAVSLGLANSKSLQIATQAVERARGVVEESRAGYNPSVAANGSYTHLNQGMTVDLNGQSIPLTKQDQKAASVTASLPIDITGLIGAAVQVSQFQEIAARLDYNRVRNQVVLDVQNAYYNVLRAKALVTVAEVALKNSQDRLTTARSYLNAGTGTRFDVLRAETDVANAQQSLISARNQVNLANAALANVLNIDQNTPLETAETTTAALPAPDFNASLADAYKLRPEVLQSDANIRAAEKGVRVAQRSALPTLGLAWTYSYSPDASGFSPQTQSWNAVAQVSIPLFDQGLARARVRQARAGVETARTEKQVALDSVALAVRQSYLGLVDALDRLKVTSAALTEAEEQFRLARVRYQAGVTASPTSSPLLEVNDAQAALTQAQTNNVNALYDAQNARARLDNAIGLNAYSAAPSPGLRAPAVR